MRERSEESQILLVPRPSFLLSLPLSLSLSLSLPRLLGILSLICASLCLFNQTRGSVFITRTNLSELSSGSFWPSPSRRFRPLHDTYIRERQAWRSGENPPRFNLRE